MMLAYLKLMLGGVALAYVAICGLLYVGQRGMMYLPTSEVNAAAEVLRIESGGETLKIWRVGDGAPALIYFGGNAEQVAGNIPAFAARFPAHTVYLVNYRGYGGSTGAPTEAGLFADALALYDFVRARHRSIGVIGRSLGGAVAAHLAAHREVRKLALVAPLDSALELARESFPLLPITLLLKDRYPTTTFVSKITAPTLIVIAAHDRIIPRHRTDALIKAFPADQLTITTLNTGHNDIDADPEYGKALAAFFRG